MVHRTSESITLQSLLCKKLITHSGKKHCCNKNKNNPVVTGWTVIVVTGSGLEIQVVLLGTLLIWWRGGANTNASFCQLL